MTKPIYNVCIHIYNTKKLFYSESEPVQHFLLHGYSSNIKYSSSQAIYIFIWYDTFKEQNGFSRRLVFWLYIICDSFKY